MPAGPISFAAGLEYRDESSDAAFDPGGKQFAIFSSSFYFYEPPAIVALEGTRWTSIQRLGAPSTHRELWVPPARWVGTHSFPSVEITDLRMFTGIIESVGEVTDLQVGDGSVGLEIRAGAFAGELAPGDSVAVDGACLTVESLEGSPFRSQPSRPP